MAIADARTRILNNLALINNAGTNVGGTSAAVSATPGDGITSPTTGMICATTDGLLYRYTGSAWASIASGGSLRPIPVDSSLTFGDASGNDRALVAFVSSGIYRVLSYGGVTIQSSPDSGGNTGNIPIKADAATGAGVQGVATLDGRSTIATAIPQVTATQTVSRVSLMHTVTVRVVDDPVAIIAPFSGFISFMSIRKTVSTGGLTSEVAVDRGGTDIITIPLTAANVNRQETMTSLEWTNTPSFSTADVITCTPANGDAECDITFYMVRTA